MLASKHVVVSRSPEQTFALGEALGRLLEPGDLVTLRGPLGAGKTLLAQGIAAGLEVEDAVCSPTFALVHQYAGRLPMWHMDAYRLRAPAEALDLGVEEVLRAGGVVALEWPEMAEGYLPPDRLEIEIVPQPDESRCLTLDGRGRRAEMLVAALAHAAKAGGTPRRA